MKIRIHRTLCSSFLFCLLAISWMVLPVEAAPRVETKATPDFAQIDAYVQAQVQDARIPGLALGIIHGDQVAHLHGFGEADSTDRAVTPHTPFFLGVLQAVDGVALKQAVDAWASAPAAEKAARFASAEVVRWLEWGTRSYQSFMFGLTLILFGAVIAGTARVPRLIGYLMGVSGLAYLVQGWVLGSEGFSATNTVPQLLAYLLVFAWSIWLLILAWRMKESVEAATA